MDLQCDQLGLLIERFQQRRPLRTGSLIITLFGDAIVPRGGAIWLGSLIELLEPMGINQRLVRTSVFRLTREGWLMAEKVGRRSYYGLTAAGRRQFEKAFKRVYAASQPAWDGAWTLVVLNQLSAELRGEARQELEHMGFGGFSPTVLAHPGLERAELNATLQEINALDDAIIFETRNQESFAPRPLRLQVREAWNLDQLSVGYREFLEQFRPLWNQMKKAKRLEPRECFLARVLLIHEYRKLMLRDPLLPEELLPSDWEGRAARQLCRNLYRLAYRGAEEWLGEYAETAEGPLPEPGEGFYQRFGGLD
ncbi:phenylacetic acid degradation operon negative regulatory protein PaaX [Alcanivorax sp. N3-2A]|nr:phenylacetic acid degradation operon negative regulatory protein PaaX [Alcanivorax sp. N3-2A]